MLKRILLMTLLVLITNLAVTPYTFASDNLEKEARFAEKVKTEIAKLGVGTDARIKVKLKDGTKLKGYISEINEDSFTVKDTKNGNATSVPYSNAKQVKGNNLSDGVVIAIAFAALFGVLIVTYIVKTRNKDYTLRRL